MSHGPLVFRALGNPTSTTTASSSTSTGSSGVSPAADPYGNLLQGRPPIIIGFLAVGGFLGVMIMLYGYRRVVQGRRLGLYQNPGGPRGRGGGVVTFRGLQQDGGERRRHAGRDIGERPLFWDLWTERGLDKEEKENLIEQGVYWRDLLVSLFVLRDLGTIAD